MRAFDYYGDVVESDMSRVDNVPRDPERVMRLMKSYARLQGTQATHGKATRAIRNAVVSGMELVTVI